METVSIPAATLMFAMIRNDSTPTTLVGDFILRRGTVNRTTFLAAIAVAAALMQLLPERANLIKWAAIGLAILYIGVRASLTYPKIYRDRRALAAQRAADRLDYERYESESAAIRDRYASIDAADEIANAEFRTQLSALHTKYAAMLERKFGRGRADDPLASQPIPTHDQGMKG